jgi:hypothetical protein
MSGGWERAMLAQSPLGRNTGVITADVMGGFGGAPRPRPMGWEDHDGAL